MADSNSSPGCFLPIPLPYPFYILKYTPRFPPESQRVPSLLDSLYLVTESREITNTINDYWLDYIPSHRKFPKGGGICLTFTIHSSVYWVYTMS